MMTCKDCLHYGVCYIVEIYGDEEANVDGVETDCNEFADRSRYVVREKGEWEVEWRVDYVDPFGETEEVPVAICPKCGEEEYATAYDEYWAKPSNFCPNCGADMRKGGRTDEVRRLSRLQGLPQTE